MVALITFILFVTISGFVVNGWYEITRYGRIFSFWSKYWEQYTQISHEHPAVHKFPEWVRSPLSECILCMASIYGTIIFGLVCIFEGENVFYGYTDLEVVFIWIAYLLSLTCANFIIHKTLK